MGRLYIVPTPVGNPEDITLRALRILKEVDLIAAPDAASARMLLKEYDISTRLVSYVQEPAIFEQLATGDVALISAGGTPGIDPDSADIVAAAIAEGYRVEPLPGANVVIPALVGSGLPTDSFLYVGMIPQKLQDRLKLFTNLTNETKTIVAHEAPERVAETLQTILDVIGDRRVAVAMNISTDDEEFQRGRAGDLVVKFERYTPRGQMTLVISGWTDEDADIWDEPRVKAVLFARMADGESLSNAAKAIAAESGWRKRDIYILGTQDM